jgi:hypothetical protein
MRKPDLAADVSKNNQPRSAATDGSGSADLGPEDDPLGGIATYSYDVNPQSARSQEQRRKGSGVNEKARAGRKPS